VGTVRLGSVVADIRGSIGDETYARNPAGLYVRARTTPVDNNTLAQQAARAAWKACGEAWSTVLSESDRNLWRMYARQWTMPNRWGVPRNISGLAWFMRTNVYAYRQFRTVDFHVCPPSGPYPAPRFTIAASEGDGLFTITLPLTEPDPPITFDRFYAFVGPSISIGRLFFNGPWRYSDYNYYGPTGWDNDPWELDAQLPIVQGDRAFVYLIRQHRFLGQISRPGRASCVVNV